MLALDETRQRRGSGKGALVQRNLSALIQTRKVMDALVGHAQYAKPCGDRALLHHLLQRLGETLCSLPFRYGHRSGARRTPSLAGKHGPFSLPFLVLLERVRRGPRSGWAFDANGVSAGVSSGAVLGRWRIGRELSLS